ncbi:hypothetical protein R1flu_018992 [Riccia fluitans]|uniref:Uncharacterized protein n=1 Tax=Riccia fluitans TaxID=41844 RepID=A0ABD1ZHF2_9MARC
MGNHGELGKAKRRPPDTNAPRRNAERDHDCEMMIKSAGECEGMEQQGYSPKHHETANNLAKRHEPGGTFEALNRKLIMKYTMRHATNAQPGIGNELTPRSVPYLSHGPPRRWECSLSPSKPQLRSA